VFIFQGVMKMTLKEHRAIKQLSQQELADESGVSIKTIQRIERNLSMGSPYIIKSLCNALKIDLTELDIAKSSQEIREYDNYKDETVQDYEDITEANVVRDKLKRLNLSAIAVIFFPFLNLIIPTILYWYYKKTLQRNADALKILTFQVLWTLLTFFIVFVVKAVFQIEFGGFPAIIWTYFWGVICNIIITIDTAIKLNKAENILPFVPQIL
jgi:transcriptional regulator with XRE-family HTH domain